MPANTHQTSNVQGRYWLLTIPHASFTPWLPRRVAYIKGQLERGEGGFLHWQILCCFEKKIRLKSVKETFGSQAHCELSRSAAANEYVWKLDTQIAGTQFELGELPFKRNDKTDWDRIKAKAQAGRLDDIDSGTYIQYYNTLKRIAADHMEFKDVDKIVKVYWGVSGSGKSHRAREEAGPKVFIKDPNTKWWDGYRPAFHNAVLIEEFTGKISIEHILRWFDKWSSGAEVKGFTVPFVCGRIWITSNVDPRKWYPDANPEQQQALLRRLDITEFKHVYKPPPAPTVLDEAMNNEFWEMAPPTPEAIPVAQTEEVPEWRDLIGDLLSSDGSVLTDFSYYSDHGQHMERKVVRITRRTKLLRPKVT